MVVDGSFAGGFIGSNQHVHGILDILHKVAGLFLCSRCRCYIHVAGYVGIQKNAFVGEVCLSRPMDIGNLSSVRCIHSYRNSFYGFVHFVWKRENGRAFVAVCSFFGSCGCNPRALLW